jgi:hypothetical protein
VNHSCDFCGKSKEDVDADRIVNITAHKPGTQGTCKTNQDLGKNGWAFACCAQVGVTDAPVDFVTKDGHLPWGYHADFDCVVLDSGDTDFNAVPNHDAFPLAPA